MLSTNFVDGAPAWVDLGAPDTARSAEFYGSVFGWTFQSAGPDAGGYGMFTRDGKVVAAAGPLSEPGAAPSWTLYFSTSDADETAAMVRKAGGTVRVEPADVMAEGRFAQFTDPAGAMFAVWQPGNTKGLGAVNDPGTLCWTELTTSDVAGTKSFYADVLGWQADDQPMGDFTYTVIKPNGGDENSSQGGIMPLSPEMAAAGATTRWQPYFEVASCDDAVAAVTANGGTVVVPASDIPGVGRFAVALDPDGAQFAVIASVPA
jgi:predicted enzyme related to lactoylglutathione lyase